MTRTHVGPNIIRRRRNVEWPCQSFVGHHVGFCSGRPVVVQVSLTHAEKRRALDAFERLAIARLELSVADVRRISGKKAGQKARRVALLHCSVAWSGLRLVVREVVHSRASQELGP